MQKVVSRWSLSSNGWAFILSLAILSVCGAVHAADTSQVAASKKRYERLLTQRPYMLQQCTDLSSKEWPEIPVRRCKYKHLGTTAEVSLIVPDAGRLARWTVTACEDAKAREIGTCIAALENRLWEASNAQFPTSGYVIEPRSVLGYPGDNSPRCFLFRDGIAMRTAEVTTRAPIDGVCMPQSAEAAPATNAFLFARLASTTREEFAKLPGVESVADLSGTKYMAVIRREFIAAWSSDRNRLLSATALSMKMHGKFE